MEPLLSLSLWFLILDPLTFGCLPSIALARPAVSVTRHFYCLIQILFYSAFHNFALLQSSFTYGSKKTEVEIKIKHRITFIFSLQYTLTNVCQFLSIVIVSTVSQIFHQIYISITNCKVIACINLFLHMVYIYRQNWWQIVLNLSRHAQASIISAEGSYLLKYFIKRKFFKNCVRNNIIMGLV